MSVSLAEFIVHTAVAAHETGVRLSGYCRENTVRLPVGSESLYPDCAFQLLPPGGAPLSFFVELDNCTERLRSAHDLDSWERKIALYDAFQDRCPRRFRVLVVTTRSGERLGRIMRLAAEKLRNPQRSLFYGITLPDYLKVNDPLHARILRDHRHWSVRLVPPERVRPEPQPQLMLATA